VIRIIFAPPGTGKTCFLTFCLVQAMFNQERNMMMRNEITSKVQNGFKSIKTIPQHCVSANYDIVGRKFRYYPRYNRKINPYRLGFANKFVKTHFNLPYEVIGITEAQKYLNSRMSRNFPDWQSRWYEAHRHNDLEILLDTQRPMLIDVNIRELSCFVEIVNLQINKDKYGRIIGMTWLVRHIDNSALFDRYMASGKKDTSCYTEEKITADFNVFNCYNSQSCKPKFYQGHMDEDFDYEQSKPLEDNRDAYIEYLQKNDDELPENFYKQSEKNKDKKEKIESGFL